MMTSKIMSLVGRMKILAGWTVMIKMMAIMMNKMMAITMTTLMTMMLDMVMVMMLVKEQHLSMNVTIMVIGNKFKY